MVVIRSNTFVSGFLLLLSWIIVLTANCGEGNPEGPVDFGDATDTIPPASITNLSVKSPAVNSLVLAWNAPGDDGMMGTASRYDVRYSPSFITEQNWDSVTQLSGEPSPKPANEVETFQVLGLASGTSYFFAIKTSDEVLNESALSNNATGATIQETVPPSDVTDLTATAINDSSFTLTWTAPGDDGITGTATQYDIRYSTSRISEQNWNLAMQVIGEPQPEPAGQWESFTVTGLVSSTNYFFALKTADEVPNWSGISNTAPAIGYNIFIWIYPTSIHQGSEINIIYRAISKETTVLGFTMRGVNYECGTPPWVTLVEGLIPSGIYSLTYDFFNNSTHDYYPTEIYYVSLCWGLELKGNIRVMLLQ